MTQPDDLEETARIARDLIRFDTTNYGEGRANSETEAAEYIGAILESLGLTTEYVDAAPGRTSVFARVEGSDRSKPALVVHGHTDVVPADPANWSVDPFAGTIKDGLLWGRGAVARTARRVAPKGSLGAGNSTVCRNWAHRMPRSERAETVGVANGRARAG